MVANMLSNKKLNTIATGLFIIGRKLKIYFVFIEQSKFLAVLKDIRLNSTHCFIMNFAKNETFSKLHLIIRQILPLKNLRISEKKCSAKPYIF